MAQPQVVTVLLFTLGGREELTIVRESQHSLAITKKTYHDGMPEPHTDCRHFNLNTEAALLRYTVGDNINVERLWQIDVVYGTRPAFTTVEYRFLREQDAFRFQRLVTGYSPYRRFKSASASVLEQRLLWRAKDVKVSGEAQLWSGAPLKFGDEQPAAADTLPGEGITVTMAKPPPLLVIFAKGATDGTYQIMRVDITKLKYRPSSSGTDTFDLVSASGSKFYFDMLSTPQAESWNICKLRPGVYSTWFKTHTCEVLTLRLGGAGEVEVFQRSLLVLQALASGVRPSRLGTATERGTSGSFKASEREGSVNPDTNSRVSVIEEEENRQTETESAPYALPGPPTRQTGPVVLGTNFNPRPRMDRGTATPITGFDSIPTSSVLGTQSAPPQLPGTQVPGQRMRSPERPHGSVFSFLSG